MPRNVKAGCAALVVAVAAVYARTASNDFVGYDDPGYVTRNVAVKRGLGLEGVAWAFRSLEQSNWHPITWLSHMADVELFGLRPAGHHLTSVALHALSAALLFVLLVQLTGRAWRSLTVAALFALHPLHVESVAWVAERKDVLSGLLWHATLLLYVAWVRKPSAGRYLAALGCFAAGLMAKPMLVTLPLVLLLLDFWPLGRLRRGGTGEAAASAARAPVALLTEKLPFAVLSLASAAVTIVAQQRGDSIVDLERAPLGFRIANAAVATVRYLEKAFWPRDLAVLYPLSTGTPGWEGIAGALVLAGITAAAVLLARRRPYVVTGWLWFLVTLLPVIGLVQVGAQSMADRYTYIPLTGVFIAIVWGAADLAARAPRPRLLAAGAAGAAIAAAAVASWSQLGYWRNSLTLFERTLAVTRDNFLILNNYGAALDEAGRTEEATRALRQAIAIQPRHAEAYYNLGRIEHVRSRDFEAARALYERAIELEPDHVDAHINLGGVLNKLGRYDRALRVLDEARALAPDRPELRFNAGVSYASLGDVGAALHEAEALRGLDPRLAAQLLEYVSRKSADPTR